MVAIVEKPIERTRLERRRSLATIAWPPSVTDHVVFVERCPALTTKCCVLHLNSEGREQFLDGCGFLLAHLGAAKAKEAPFLGRFSDLLRRRHEPLLKPLGRYYVAMGARFFFGNDFLAEL